MPTISMGLMLVGVVSFGGGIALLNIRKRLRALEALGLMRVQSTHTEIHGSDLKAELAINP